jgi:hypothetical protein
MVTQTQPAIVTADCPNCGNGKKADLIGQSSHTTTDDSDGTWLEVAMRLLRCRGCETLFAYRGTTFSEHTDYVENPYTGQMELRYLTDEAYWPKNPKRNRPPWIDEIHKTDVDLDILLDEVYTARNEDMLTLCAIGIRTVFDKASELLGIDTELGFKKKLDALVQKQKISKDEMESLTILVDAGNAAAHRGWRPNQRLIDTMMLVLESFLHRCFIVADSATKLKTAVPVRKGKTIATKNPAKPVAKKK